MKYVKMVEVEGLKCKDCIHFSEHLGHHCKVTKQVTTPNDDCMIGPEDDGARKPGRQMGDIDEQ